MKLFLLTLIIAASCSKEVEKPIVMKSVTYLCYRFDTKHSLIRIDTSIHWCKVGGDDLRRFEAITKKDEYICGTVEDRLILVIGPACK